MTGAAPTLRDQLVEARERITAQLDDMNFRATAPQGGTTAFYRPDYRSLIAELQGELREIDGLLNTQDSPDA